MRVLYLFYFFGSFGIIFSGNESNSSLIFIQIISRHSARSPLHFLPSDQNFFSLWPEGLGQLTALGKLQAIDFGKFIWKRYVEEEKLLSNQYKNHEIYVRSSDKDRTIMTALITLESLYSSIIPIHSSDFLTDYLLSNEYCQRLIEENKEVNKGQEVKNILSQYQNVFDYVSDKTGSKVTDLYQLSHITDNFVCLQTNNMTIPEWCKNEINNKTVMDNLLFLFNKKFDLFFNRGKESKRKAGFLLNDIINNLENKSKNKSETKANFYFTHDTMLSGLLSAISVFNSLQPPFMSSLIFELHNVSNSFHVITSYKNQSDLAPYVLEIPGCEVKCPLEKFIDLAKVNSFHDYKATCDHIPFYRDGKITLIIGMIVIISLLLLVILLLLLLVVRCCRGKPYHQYIDLPTEIE